MEKVNYTQTPEYKYAVDQMAQEIFDARHEETWQYNAHLVALISRFHQKARSEKKRVRMLTIKTDVDKMFWEIDNEEQIEEMAAMVAGQARVEINDH